MLCKLHMKTCPCNIWRFISAVKIKNFSGKFRYFNIFAQNIDCGYTLEQPHGDSLNECPQSLFLIKIRKIGICLLTPVECYIKVGLFTTRKGFLDARMKTELICALI